MTDNAFKHLIATEERELCKQYLDRRLEKIFSSGGRFAVINQIQLIPIEALTLLYSYADGENSKFIGVLLLLTLHIDQTISAIKRLEFENNYNSLSFFVEEHLTNHWAGQLHPEHLKPLLARIGNNLCFVK